MNALLEAIKLFEFSMVYRCKACRSTELKPDALFEHLEHCPDAKENPILTNMIVYEIKWQEKFMHFRATQSLIIHGGRPFEEDECAGCTNFEDHKLGMCETHLKRVDAYKRSVDPLISDLIFCFKQWLIEREKLQLREANAHYDQTEKKVQTDIKKYEKLLREATTEAESLKFANPINRLRKALVDYKKHREYRLKAEDAIQLPLDKMYVNFTAAMKQLYDEDIAKHRTFDTNLEIRNSVPNQTFEFQTNIPYNKVLDRFIEASRLTENIGHNLARQNTFRIRSQRAEDLEFEANLAEANAFFEKYMKRRNPSLRALRRSMRTAIESMRPRRITHVDRLNQIRHYGALGNSSVFRSAAEHPAMVDNYNNATGWYVATVQEQRVEIRKVMERFDDACRDVAVFDEFVQDYIKMRRLIPYFLGFTEGAKLAMKKLQGFRGHVNSPTEPHMSVPFREGRLNQTYKEHNYRSYQEIRKETTRHRDKVKEAMMFAEETPMYPKLAEFLTILEMFIEEDQRRVARIPYTKTERFECLIWTWGEFDFDRDQPGAHMLQERNRAMMDEFMFGGADNRFMHID